MLSKYISILLTRKHQIQRASQEPVLLDINHPPPSPEPPSQASTPRRSPIYNSQLATSTRKRQLDDQQAWPSPAFLIRSKNKDRDDFLGWSYDPFAEQEYPDNDRQKRIRFGLGSRQWRFAERTPSPVKKPENTAFHASSPSTLVKGQAESVDKEAASPVQKADGAEHPSNIPNGLNDHFSIQDQLSAELESNSGIGMGLAKQEHNSGSGDKATDDRQTVDQVATNEDLKSSRIDQLSSPPAGVYVPEVETPMELTAAPKGHALASTESTDSSSSQSASMRRLSPSPGYIHVFEDGNPWERPKRPPSTSTESIASSSSSHPETDQESGVPEPDIDSEGVAFSGPSSDFGLDGAAFSRAQGLPKGALTVLEKDAEPEQQTKAVDELEHGVSQVPSLPQRDVADVNGRFTGDYPSKGANDVQHPLVPVESRIAQTDEPARELLIMTKDQDRDSLTLDDGGLEQNLDLLDRQQAAQQRSSVLLPSSDPLQSQEPQDDFIEEISEGQLLPEDGNVSKTPVRDETVKDNMPAEGNEDHMMIKSESSRDQKPVAGQGQDLVMSDERLLERPIEEMQESKIEIIDLESYSEEDSGDLSSPTAASPDTFPQFTDIVGTTTEDHVRPETEERNTVLDKNRSELNVLSVSPVEEHLPEKPETFSERDNAPPPSEVPSFEEQPSRQRPLEEHDPPEPPPEPIPSQELPSTVPDSLADLSLKGQLWTPNTTQRTSFVSQPSSVWVHSAPEEDTLPTPRLTQGTSAGIILPSTPITSQEPVLATKKSPVAGESDQESASIEKKPPPPSKESALVEKLKSMRGLSRKQSRRVSDTSAISPWFAPKRSFQVVPDSEAETETESPSDGDQGPTASKPSGDITTPEKRLAKFFIRSPPQRERTITSLVSSPQYLPPSQPPPPGFRTNLSYFVPLATLPSHFATTTDILAIAVASSPVSRATSGPKDYNQTICITDPSAATSLNPPVTTVQIFRPSKTVFPLLERGDALLLRDFKVQSFQKRLSLLSTESSAWAVFRRGVDVQVRGPPVEFGAEERGFARGLWDWWASLGQDTRGTIEEAVPRDKKNELSRRSNREDNRDRSFNGTIPEYQKLERTMDSNPRKAKKHEKNVSQTPSFDSPSSSATNFKKEAVIEGLKVDLPASQSKANARAKERWLKLDCATDTLDSTSPPTRALRSRGARNKTPERSESPTKFIKHELRDGTTYTDEGGEPETQNGLHELRDGRTYRDRR